MAVKIEVQGFFYDLFHCKDKILTMFDQFDEQFGDDPRGALVAGIRECPDEELVNLLINIQRLATGFEQIKELIDQAEQAEVEAQQKILEGESDEDDDDF